MASTNPGGKIELPVLSNQALALGARPGLDQPFVTGKLQSAAGLVPQVSSTLTRDDRLGTLRARWGGWRMHYAVDPGLYALGTPDEQSVILVSANYKMSFDILRAASLGRNAWILVLDTKGINVWCAAGKGTFGTKELIGRIEASGLRKVSPQGKLIVPQLGAPGVAAHEVKRQTGYRVFYGPVRAADLPAYLDAGLQATPAMREVRFDWQDRGVLIPMELTGAIKPFALIGAIFFVVATLAGFAAGLAEGPGGLWASAVMDGLFAVCALAAAVLAGAVLHPLLLPFFPVRAFSLQGAMAGGMVAAGCLWARGVSLDAWPGLLEAAAWLLIIAAIASYLALNFTGSSTYTSLSGVKKEMRFALPAQIAAGITGCVLWLGSLLARLWS